MAWGLEQTLGTTPQYPDDQCEGQLEDGTANTNFIGQSAPSAA
jgi:hypothetical protein